MPAVLLAHYVNATVQQLSKLPPQYQQELIQQELQRRGVVENFQTGMSVYLMVLGCLSATGGIVVGSIKFFGYMIGTYKVATKPKKASPEEVEMFNKPFQDDPAVGVVFDQAIKESTKGRHVPEAVKEAGQNLRGARSRESSPSGSARSSGSGGAGPSEIPWIKWSEDYKYRDVNGRRQWLRRNSKNHWKASNGPELY